MNISLVKKAMDAQEDWKNAAAAVVDFHKQQTSKARQYPSAEYLETRLALLRTQRTAGIALRDAIYAMG